MKYAELIGNYKNHRIKSLWDNKIDVEYGTGLFAENGNGRKDVPWLYKDDEGKTHITSGQHPHPYMRPALEENKDKVIKRLRRALND